jgi:hypothetical protein
VVASSLAIALLVTVGSVTGLVFQDAIYPTDELQQTFVANDVVNLLIGVPILLGAVWLARRGKLIGLLLWPGALFFVIYNAIAYVYALPMGWAFVLDLVLLALAIYALAGLVACIDGAQVGERLDGKVPERWAGGVLMGLGILFLVREIGVLASAIAGGDTLPRAEMAVLVADALIMPAWIIGGALLWRRRDVGYVTGTGLLFQGSMLFIGLLIFLLLQPVLTGAAFGLADVVVVFVTGLVCFVPFALFVRGVVRS